MSVFFLLYIGGLCYWASILFGGRPLLIAGAGSLALSFLMMVHRESVSLAILPLLAAAAFLVWSIRRNCFPVGKAASWATYVALVLSLGFHQFPGLSPFFLEDSISGDPVKFSPEKLFLLLIVPPLVLDAVVPRLHPLFERSGGTPVLMLLLTLSILIPLAIILDQARPGFPTLSWPVVIYKLAYNFLFVCVIEESFFRGIVQTALLRWARHQMWPSADSLALSGASVLFGAVHWGGGYSFVLLATLAGFGYGAIYYATRRIYHAVLLHFAVNAIHQLFFAGALATASINSA